MRPVIPTIDGRRDLILVRHVSFGNATTNGDPSACARDDMVECHFKSLPISTLLMPSHGCVPDTIRHD
ncbi:hypothetical protein CCC_02516 [Paramagnetospirillum magnetotacticum MS-1]|uniref:Uncharacterized protein n=1 Tax=Paramagnetospirillum magnetotacticum MS-1 TaxID=272627 RepID=A0A0C2V1V5_PARME|nr:hypothetical protein CCC_02516 [Paramagnetospirillum magnetotacticum MS-1]